MERECGFLRVLQRIHLDIFHSGPEKLQVRRGRISCPAKQSISSMLKQMNGKSWLVRAKLMFRLERSSGEKAGILAELLEVSYIYVTSSHKPITHS